MIKVGMIGCGKITQLRHAPEYKENPNCEIAGFFDTDSDRAQELADIYGGVVFSSVEEMLKSDLDAVSVCVANKFHGEISVKSLNAGKHVLCEKPMAISIAECEQMITAAKESDKNLMIGQNQRFAEAHVKARELIVEGVIGTPLVFETHFGHPGPEGWTGEKNSWFFDKKTAAFGAMADLGVHKTDLMHYLLGESIVQVAASLTTVDKKFPDGTPITVDDNAFCIYTTESGIKGTMHVSWTFYGQENNSTIIYGTKGVLRCYDDPEYSLILERSDGTIEKFSLDKLTSNKEQNTGGRTSTGVIDEFVASIIENRKPSIDGEEAIKAMRVIFAAEQSSQQNKTVEIQQ